MQGAKAQTKPDSLGLEDGDDVDLILAIERSFGVRFGDKTTKWFTVGDIYDALLAGASTNEKAGLCSTSMAFYRLRAALPYRQGVRGRVSPKTKLTDLVDLPAKRLFPIIAKELGLGSLAIKFSLWGKLGGIVILIGFFSIFLPLFNHSLWPLMLLMPTGIAMIRTDTGIYGSTTVGDLARRIAARNFIRFAATGADTRPSAVWRALCDLIADQADFDRRRITPDTRLIA